MYAYPLMVTSIILIAVGLAVTVAVFGFIMLQSLSPLGDAILSPVEQKCRQIANEGYRIHAAYPDSSFDAIPEEDAQKMIRLDERWINECVSVLPTATIIEIVDGVERKNFGE